MLSSDEGLDSALITQGREENGEQNAFEKLFFHDVQMSHLMARWKKVIQLLTLGGISGVAAMNYVPPARAYAESSHPILPSTNPIHSEIGTCIPSAAVLVVSTEAFLTWLSAQHIASPLKSLLALVESAQTRRIKYVGITLGSLVSSAVLTGTYLAYPNDDPAWKTAILSTIILASNTILHFLPFMLMSQDKVYRFPVLPIEAAVKALMAKYEPLSKKQADAEHAFKRANMQILQSRFNGLFQGGTNALVRATLADQSFSWRGGRLLNPEVITTLKKVMALLHETEPLLTPSEALLFVLNQAPGSTLATLSSSNSAILKGGYAMVEMTYVILIIMGLSGYLANSTSLIAEKQGLAQGLVLSAVPNYALSVLLAFFAREFAKADANTLRSIGKGEFEWPLMVQLYPLPYLVMHVASLYVLCFSHAGAMGMVDLNIPADLFESEAWQQFRQVLVGITIGGIGYLSIKMLDQLYKSLLHKFTLYLGNENRQILTTFMERSAAMEGHVGLLRPEVLKGLVENLSESDAQAYFQLSNAELKEQVPYLLGNGAPVVVSDPRSSCLRGRGAFWSPSARRSSGLPSATDSRVVETQGSEEDGERATAMSRCAIL